MTSAVRAGRKSDLRALSTTLARAFEDDPVMSWMLPDAATRIRGLSRLFGTLTRYHHLGAGGVEVALGENGEVAGATLWDPPGKWRQSRFTDLRMMPGLIRAFGNRLQASGTIAETMKANHPDEPHWYLAVIGTDPSARGAGHGYALMRSRLDRVDAEHAPAYLESSKPQNVPYYERFGFEVTHEIELPGGCPPVWAMWRKPV